MRDKDGWSPTALGFYKNRAEATQILLDAGADPKACDLRRRMPLYWLSSPIIIFKLVLKSQDQENGADIVKLAGVQENAREKKEGRQEKCYNVISLRKKAHQRRIPRRFVFEFAVHHRRRPLHLLQGSFRNGKSDYGGREFERT